MAGLGARFLLAAGLVASSVAALGQNCVDGIYTNNGICDEGIQAKWGLTGALTVVGYTVQVRGIYDPIRNITNGPANWTTIDSCGTPDQTYPLGAGVQGCFKIWTNSQAATDCQAVGGTLQSGGFGWPVRALQAYPTGRFEIKFILMLNSMNKELTYRVYKTNGVFHCAPPPPNIDPPVDDSDPAVGEGKIVIRPYVYMSSVPQDGILIRLRGPVSATGVTGADGSVRFVDTGVGTFRVEVDGHSETGKKLTAQHTFIVDSVRVYKPLFYFDSNGNLLGIKMGDETGDSGGGGGGIGEEALGGLLQSLFIPSDESVEALFRNMDEFFNWGPLGVIMDIKDLMLNEDPGLLELQDYFRRPSFSFNAETGEMAQGAWDGQSYWVDFGMFEGNGPEAFGGVGYIRAALGALVYVCFVGFLVKVFTPKHTIS